MDYFPIIFIGSMCQSVSIRENIKKEQGAKKNEKGAEKK